ncbi:DUF732 domain-containing protein [Gordonia sp. HY442]|uniref:DUF732 domain-containing protein n=1 Tax=Gordonia zhenghanii TaxID=2911516 RepID=UPI001F177309|nr:DUF732 domain-containing protein [Gordonia zhenghanii]MCF8606551.1 DUF732 domain-containing protein [Gordonia zhenghanii]
MRLRTAFVAPMIVAVALVSGACGSDDSNSDSPDSSHRQAYLSAVKVTGVKFADDDEAVSVGQKICKDLENGTSVSDAAKGVSQAANSGQGAAVVGAAMGSFCPGAAKDMMPDKSDLPTMPSVDLPG